MIRIAEKPISPESVERLGRGEGDLRWRLAKVIQVFLIPSYLIF
ncbi:hypothetical protein ACFLTP_09635 [Chloroflexota bacterium]